MSLEEQLSRWTSPSSDTEQDKQERTERMIRQAVDAHTPFNNCDLKIYAKGSYANNTNVRADSDVDVAVECKEALYWEEEKQGLYPPGNKYEGVWSPTKLRSELLVSLKAKFGENVDSSGSTAIQINSGPSRVDADVVPCFSYKYHLENEVRSGSANLNSRISGNSAYFEMLGASPVQRSFHHEVEEESQCGQTGAAHAQRRVQGPRGACRAARGQDHGRSMSGI